MRVDTSPKNEVCIKEVVDNLNNFVSILMDEFVKYL